MEAVFVVPWQMELVEHGTAGSRVHMVVSERRLARLHPHAILPDPTSSDGVMATFFGLGMRVVTVPQSSATKHVQTDAQIQHVLHALDMDLARNILVPVAISMRLIKTVAAVQLLRS